jgi:hypothetical protein
MKITYSVLGLTTGAVLLLASGCSKQEQPSGEPPKVTPPAASDMQKAPEAAKPATEPAPAAAAAATDASQAASAAASDAQKAVEAAAASSVTNTQASGLIYNAQGLVKDQKYQDALNVVQQLSTLKLTPEQQKLVDGLKTQIQAALAKATGADAASALGNVLGGKK